MSFIFSPLFLSRYIALDGIVQAHYKRCEIRENEEDRTCVIDRFSMPEKHFQVTREMWPDGNIQIPMRSIGMRCNEFRRTSNLHSIVRQISQGVVCLVLKPGELIIKSRIFNLNSLCPTLQLCYALLKSSSYAIMQLYHCHVLVGCICAALLKFAQFL